MLDQLFIITNFEEEDQKDNPDKLLIRFEFIELLIRIAKEKYYKKKEEPEGNSSARKNNVLIRSPTKNITNSTT